MQFDKNPTQKVTGGYNVTDNSVKRTPLNESQLSKLKTSIYGKNAPVGPGGGGGGRLPSFISTRKLIP